MRQRTLMQKFFYPVVAVLLIMLCAGGVIAITLAVLIGAGQAERSKRDAWIEKKKAEYGNYPTEAYEVAE